MFLWGVQQLASWRFTLIFESKNSSNNTSTSAYIEQCCEAGSVPVGTVRQEKEEKKNSLNTPTIFIEWFSPSQSTSDNGWTILLISSDILHDSIVHATINAALFELRTLRTH